VDLIALEEIGEAALLCLEDDFALARERLIQETARLLGYDRVGDNIGPRIDEAIRLLEKEGRIRIQGDQISLAS